MFGGWLALMSINPQFRELVPGADFPFLKPAALHTEEGVFLTEVLCTFTFVLVIMIFKEPRLGSNMAGNTPIILISIALALAC